MLANRVKRRIRAGQPAFGSLPNFGDPPVAELMAVDLSLRTDPAPHFARARTEGA